MSGIEVRFFFSLCRPFRAGCVFFGLPRLKKPGLSFHGPSGRHLYLDVPLTANPSSSREAVIQQRGRRIKPGHARREQGTTSRNGGTLKKRLTLPEISSLSGRAIRM